MLGDKDTLFPNMPETLRAAETLVRDGFRVMVYCSDDPVQAREFVFKTLRETGRLQEVFERIERPLMPVVQRMHESGIALDTGYLKTLDDFRAVPVRSAAGGIPVTVGDVASMAQVRRELAQSQQASAASLRRSIRGWAGARLRRSR